MDLKRLMLALVLSLVFILTWNVVFPPDNNIEQEKQSIASNNIVKEKEQEKLTLTTKIIFDII